MKSLWFLFATIIVAVTPSLLFAATTVAATPSLDEQGFFTAYSRNWMLGYIFAGAILYTIDRTWLIKVKSWFQDPSAKPSGFIYGQKVSKKVVWAGVISTAESIGFLFTPWNSHLSVELFLWLVDIPMMLIGFGIGAAFFPLWEKREKAYEAIDKGIQEGERMVETVSEKISSSSTSVPTPAPQPVTVSSAPVPEKAPVSTEPVLTAEQRIQQYAKR